MARDPYAWIDPFEEIERANRAASYAREDGRRDILNRLLDGRKKEFHEELDAAISDACRKVAHNIVLPAIRAAWSEKDMLDKFNDATLKAWSLSGPLRAAIHANATTELRPFGEPGRAIESLRLTVHMVRPFEWTVAMCRGWDLPPKEAAA